jgi:phage tail sheath protein FI
MAFASPGVSIKEIDLTPTVNVSDQNIGAVVIAAESGPVDEVIYVTSEKELVEIFGKPNEKNYESWFAANSIIQYGGIAAVVRPSGSSSGLLTANSDGLTNLLVKNKTQFEKYSEPGNTVNFKFAARTAGSRFNALKVVAVDHGADQVVTYTTIDNDPVYAAGDYIKIVNTTPNPDETVGYGWIYKVDTTNKKLYITLEDSTNRLPASTTASALAGYTLLKADNTTLVAAGDIASVVNDYYDSLEYAPGLKWRDIAPQPGTSFGVQKLGGRFDEMHILVLDEQGTIAGERNAIIEKYTFVSKAKDGGNLDGALTYFHDAISQKSTYIYPGAGTGINFYSASSLPLDNVTLPGSSSSTVTGTIADSAASSKDRLYTLIAYNDPSDSPDGGISSSIGFTFLSAATTSKETGSNYTAVDLTSAIETGYDIFSDAEEFNDIDFLIPGTMSGQLINRLITIAEARRDCMVVASPSRSSVTGSETTSQKTDLIVDFFANINRSSFAILDSGYKYIYDKYNQKYRFVPCAADVAGLCISTTINSETWFSPAGYNRGNLRNATKLAYSPKQSERDRLYNNAINPIVSFPGQGIVLFGDKTALNSTSAFSRINVRRLFVEIEKNIARFAKFQLFEVNDDVTRSSFKAAVEPYLRGVQGRRGIYDFLVVCDETNNTSDVIDRNEFNAEIYIQPARSINYITITFIATRTGVSFGELTQ